MRLETVAAERYRAAVKQVLASQAFHDAPVQQKLLAYLAEKSFAGAVAELKEYSIGVELFGKREDYSPQTDPSVRVQAGRLRRKLEEYYRAEGTEATDVIQLPKGSFQLVFEERTPETAGDLPSLPACSPLPARERQEPSATRIATGRVWIGVLAIALIIFCAWVCVWQFFQLRRLEKDLAQKSLTPAQAQLWNPILASPRPLLLVLGVPMFIKIAGGSYRHNKVNSPEDIAGVPSALELIHRMDVRDLHFSHTYTGVGEAEAVFLLGRLFQAAGKGVSISRSNELGWDEAVSNDLVLIGSSKSQPHLRELGMLPDYRLVPGGIEVLHPLLGEPAFYRPAEAPHQLPTEDYAIVARLPGINGNGFVMVIGADSTTGTWAGAELVTDPQRAQPLVDRLRDSSGRLPDYFELIVKAELKGERPVAISYVRHRVISPSARK